MSDKTKFWILVSLFVLSLTLLWVLNSRANSVLFQ